MLIYIFPQFHKIYILWLRSDKTWPIKPIYRMVYGIEPINKKKYIHYPSSFVTMIITIIYNIFYFCTINYSINQRNSFTWTNISWQLWIGNNCGICQCICAKPAYFFIFYTTFKHRYKQNPSDKNWPSFRVCFWDTSWSLFGCNYLLCLPCHTGR